MLLVIVIIMFTLTSLFNFYPGGYSFETSNNEVFIEKGMQNKEAYDFKVTKDNELKISLLKNAINNTKMLWYVSIFFITTLLIGLASFLRLKNKLAFTITLILFISAMIFVSISFINSINQSII